MRSTKSTYAGTGFQNEFKNRKVYEDKVDFINNT